MSALSTAPATIVKVLESINSQSVSGFFSSFTDDAILTDEGKDYTGKTEIEKWFLDSLAGHNASIEVKKVTDLSTNVVVHVLMDGDFEADFGLVDPFDLYFSFFLANNAVKSLSITDWDSANPTMNAVWISKGLPEDPVGSIHISKRPQVEAPEGWIKVKMEAAGLNFHDVFTLRGAEMTGLTFPRIIGCEGAGTLEDGSKVLLFPAMGDPDWKGDETLDPARNVFSEAIDGTLAEYVIAPARNVLPRPDALDVISASVLGVAWLTAYRMLFTKSGLKAGQIMLVQGASGGVATALIQLGSAAGMRVWSVGRTEKKRALGLRLGAERVFAPGEELPEKADSVFDTSGAATFAHSVDSCKVGGTIVTCGGHSGMNVTVDLMLLVVNQISVHGNYLGTLEEFRDLITFVVAKGIKPHVGLVVPLEEARTGFQRMVDGRTDGKIVVTMG